MDLSTSSRRLRSVETVAPPRRTASNEALNPPNGIVSPSPASTEKQTKSSKKSEVLVDYKANDYRGFIFVVHAAYGLMLLQCTRKKKKPLHWQLPGGHIDDFEFIEAGCQSSDRNNQLLIAGRIGAARELYEETGLDVRSKLDRLEPASLRTKTKIKHGVELLKNEFNFRLFYFLSVTDEDFASKGETPCGADARHLKLKLSVEHSGFTFQPEPSQAAEMLKLHSGGKVSKALLMALEGASDNDEESAASPVRDPKLASESAASPVRDPKLASASTPGSLRRRSKREKEGKEPVDLLPLPVKESMFCCFGF